MLSPEDGSLHGRASTLASARCPYCPCFCAIVRVFNDGSVKEGAGLLSWQLHAECCMQCC